MSRAFIKEDVDPPERSGRTRSASGLPPGAVNYITARGAARLRQELANLRRGGGNAGGIGELERILASVTVVEAPDDSEESVGFGAKVTVRDAVGDLRTYRIVGVDELDLYPDAVSWVSSIGKALLAADGGDWVTLEKSGRVKVVRIEYPAD